MQPYRVSVSNFQKETNLTLGSIISPKDISHEESDINIKTDVYSITNSTGGTFEEKFTFPSTIVVESNKVAG